MHDLIRDVRKVPVLPLALAVIVGIVFALHCDMNPSLLFWVSVGAFVAVVLGLLVLRSRFLGFMLFLVFAGLLSAFRATIMLDREARARLSVMSRNCDEVMVIGKTIFPSSDDSRSKTVSLGRCLVIGARDSVSSESGRIRLVSDGIGIRKLRYGDWVYARGRLSAGRDIARTQGALVRSVVQREIGALYADSAEIFILAGHAWTFRRWIDRLRERIQSAFQANLSPDGAALCNALLLGDRSGFSSEFAGNLRITGLSHIFALSGMNTGFIVLLVWIAISWVPIPHSLRLLILLLAVLIYMELGREAPSLVRSSLVAVSVIVGALLHRKAVLLNLVMAAALVELLWRPLDLVDAGFLLSYFAVIAIIAAYSPIRQSLVKFWRRPPSWWKVIAGIAAGTIAAQLGAAPLVGYLFHRVPLAGVLANLVVVPGFALMLVLSVVLVVLDLVFPWLAGMTASALNLVSWTLGSLVNWVARMPIASVEVGSFYLLILVGFSAAMAVVLVGMAFQQRRLAVAGVLAGGSLVAWSLVFSPSNPSCQVAFLDVGNGDATLITAGSTHVLVDCGPAFGEWSAAHRIEAELTERGIGQLDAIILTHSDVDHIGGAAKLLEDVPVRHVFSNDEDVTTASTALLGLVMATKRLTCERLGAGDMLSLTSNASLTVLAPDSLQLAGEIVDNRRSIIMRLDADSASILLMGDADSTLDARLASWGRLADVNLLLVPHHGSASSTSSTLLSLTSPMTCVISCGARNIYGHPSPEVLQRILTVGADVHVTAWEGTLAFIADGNKWRTVASPADQTARRWKLDV